MHVIQRKEKQHLKCECCTQWKDDWFCDWKTYGEEELVICSECGKREATENEKKLIKVHKHKADVYTKTKLGRKDVKPGKNSKRVGTDSLF